MSESTSNDVHTAAHERSPSEGCIDIHILGPQGVGKSMLARIIRHGSKIPGAPKIDVFEHQVNNAGELEFTTTELKLRMKPNDIAIVMYRFT